MKTMNICDILVDAKVQAKKHPATFHYPKDEIKDIRESDYVKICHNGERFWVMLTEVNGNKLVGFVNNDLVREHPFKCDDKVSFEKRHIYQVYGGW